MSCAHVVVVTMMLAVAGPATAMPPLLATALVGGALLLLCAPAPPAITLGLAVASGLLLEPAYSAQTSDPAPLGSLFRLALLAAVTLGAAVLRDRRANDPR